MATTTNFGWTTPNDTDLVSQGAAAIRTLGSAIDTSMMDLKGGTTGQVLSKASNTDMDFTWSSVDPLTILDAKGDLISATAADTPARLASSGVNGDVLTVDTSTSTGLKWAAPNTGANWSLLNAGGTALTGAATITVSGISGKDKLMVIIQGASNATTDSSIFSIRFNADTGNNYYQWGGFRTWTTTGEWQLPDSGTRSSFNITNNGNIAQQTTGYVLLSGGNSSGVKQVQYFGLPNWQGYNAGESYQGIGYYNSSSTISSVSFLSSAGNFDAGTLYVYASA